MKFLFWVSTAALLYIYIGYPVAICLLARLHRPRIRKAPITPLVSVVVPCHNEAATVVSRIKNLHKSQYPLDRLEIIVVSDGSTDRTVEEVSRHTSSQMRVLAYSGRQGKAAALNAGVSCASGEIIVFADARQSFAPNAIAELIANFADPQVGAVSGAYMLGDPTSAVAQGVGFYWMYEEWIRRNEGRFDSIIGATGAIYAIRHDLWKPLPESTILDDVYTPMQIASRGFRVVFEDKAVAYDLAANSTSREFSRKARTLTGNYQLCQSMPRLLVPSHRLWIQFVSHKVFRLAAPFFLLAILLSNIGLASDLPIYQVSLAAQISFYATVLAGASLRNHKRSLKLLNVAYMFFVMNVAALVGFFNFLRGKRNVWVVNG